MKKALDNPNLGIKVIDVREAEGLTANHAKYANRETTNPYFLRTEIFRVVCVFRGST